MGSHGFYSDNEEVALSLPPFIFGRVPISARCRGQEGRLQVASPPITLLCLGAEHCNTPANEERVDGSTGQRPAQGRHWPFLHPARLNRAGSCPNIWCMTSVRARSDRVKRVCAHHCCSTTRAGALCWLVSHSIRARPCWSARSRVAA